MLKCPKISICSTGGGSQRIRIASVLENINGQSQYISKIISVCGWLRSCRVQGKAFCFLDLSDGSTKSSLQIIVHNTIPNFDTISALTTGASLRCTGEIVESPGTNQFVEMVIKSPESHSAVVYGTADAKTYPLSKKYHSKEFLRTLAHLRPRSNLFGAVIRIRHNMCIATHDFFHRKGFLYIQTPIITSSDCEGAGEMFQVSVNSSPTPPSANKTPDLEKHFFGREAFLTVSGQLSVESFSCSMSDVYTFGPTFRAENSHTSRHLSEFWMIEPEIAFATLEDNIILAESYLKYCIEWAFTYCKEDLEFFEKHIYKDLISELKRYLEEPFARVTYTEAINKLQACKGDLEQVPQWGDDLNSEQERYLTEKLYQKPLIVYNYPKDIKSFYMRLNEDEKTVAAMDILVPRIGEIIGGSAREERLNYLEAAIKAKNLKASEYQWYIDFRRYGTVPHAGFGLGFERLILLMTGLENIRDTIPFPRYPGQLSY